MTTLVVGCPVRQRAWILKRWFQHLQDATFVEPLTPHLVFVGDPRSDPDTFNEIDRLCLQRSWSRDVIEVPEEHSTVERVWNIDRYKHMAELRNALLAHVRTIGPQLFWSVDSDMLVHPKAFASAFTALDRFDAVGSKAYMTPTGVDIPSFAQLNNGGLLRWNDSGCFPVDVIMAIKLMTPKAYDVDYVVHFQGEDIGWSEQARSAGCKLGWDGAYTSRHVMGPEYLDRADDRV